MNEWFKKIISRIKERWAKWTIVQKGIFIGVIVAVLAAIIIMISVSGKPSAVRLFNNPVTEEDFAKIEERLEKDNVNVYYSSDGYVLVDSDSLAKRYRPRLISEGVYSPSRSDPYSMFGIKNWSRTDFDDKVNWKNHIEKSVRELLTGLDDIRRADVVVNIPDEAMFEDDQNPTTSTVTIWAEYGSDILSNRKRVLAIQNMILTCVEGLKAEDLTLVNGASGEQINDFESLAESDRLDNVKKQNKITSNEEHALESKIRQILVDQVGKDRVSKVAVSLDYDYSKTNVQSKEYSGVTIKKDNPDTPYDDSEIRDNLVLSFEKVDKSFTGTGYNPEGPAGVEGQNPPVYSDMSNVIGKTEETGLKQNNALNEKNIQKEINVERMARNASANIDGIWTKKMKDGKYVIHPDTGGFTWEYTPVPETELKNFEEQVKRAINFDDSRGDSVTITNNPVDRRAEHEAEDRAYIKAQQTKKTILYVLVGIAVVLLFFIIFRLISREIERRRRLREEESLRRQQAEREKALWDAKDQGVEVTMSVEERHRAELQENAIAMAKEHPEDVAMLIRTWLMEE